MTGRASATFVSPLARVQRGLRRLPAGLRRVVTSAGWLTVDQAVRMVVGLLVGVYVARHLGPESFGILNYAISFVFLFSCLGRLGLDNLVVRELVARPREESETLGAAFALRLTGGALACFLIIGAALATQDDATTGFLIVIIAAGLVFQSLEVSAYWFFAHTLSRPVVFARLGALALASGLRIAFIVLGMPVVWFAWPVLIDLALAATLMFILLIRHAPASALRWRPRLARMIEMLKRAWPLALSVAFIEMQLRIDQVMLGEMLGAREVGWYGAAARLSQAAYVLPTAIATAVFPAVVRARETSTQVYDRRMQMFYDVMLWLGIGVALPAALIAGPAVHVLYGEAYLPTATILQIHIWSLALVGLGTARSRWLIAEGLERFVLLASLVGVVANVTLNWVLIPTHGGTGAAWATLLALVIGTYGVSFAVARLRPAGRMMATALLGPMSAWQAARAALEAPPSRP